MLYQLVLLFHVFLGVFIIALVLVQQGKGATMGAAFGSGASSTVFGSRGSGSFLFRVTVVCIGLFFVTSIMMNSMTAQASKEERVITLPLQEAPLNKAPADKASEIPVRK